MVECPSRGAAAGDVAARLASSFSRSSLGEPGLSFLIYTAEPGSPSEERLKLLASLAATSPAAAPRDGHSTIKEN